MKMWHATRRPRPRRCRWVPSGTMALFPLGLCLLLLPVTTAGSYASQPYRMIDLGTPTADRYSVGAAINNSGQVVGWTGTGYETRAFVWDAVGGIRVLDALPGDLVSQAYDINDLGQVVGMSTDDPSYGITRAFIWDIDGGMRELPLPPGAERGRAMAINNLGQVAGYGRLAGGRSHAWLWDQLLGITDLGTLPGDFWSMAISINDRGEVVGSSCGSREGRYSPFIWDPAIGMRDLGIFGGSANDINDLGQVVGCSLHPLRSFLWDPEGGTTIIPGVTANAINNAGQLVGSLSDFLGGAFLWSESTGLTILSADPSSTAIDINDAGQIVGISGGRAVMWEVIPEPSSLAALGLAVSGLGTAAVKRRRRG